MHRHQLTLPDVINSVQIDLTYIGSEDRMLLTVNTEKLDLNWWLTRNLMLRFIKAWAAKLEEVALPSVSGFLPNVPRNLQQEHSLALEFDGPQPKTDKPIFNKSNAGLLIEEINLKVNGIQTQVSLRGEGKETTLKLSRRETHAFLEMLFVKSQYAGWLNAVTFPEWLNPQDLKT